VRERRRRCKSNKEQWDSFGVKKKETDAGMVGGSERCVNYQLSGENSFKFIFRKKNDLGDLLFPLCASDFYSLLSVRPGESIVQQFGINFNFQGIKTLFFFHQSCSGVLFEVSILYTPVRFPEPAPAMEERENSSSPLYHNASAGGSESEEYKPPRIDTNHGNIVKPQKHYTPLSALTENEPSETAEQGETALLNNLELQYSLRHGADLYGDDFQDDDGENSLSPLGFRLKRIIYQNPLNSFLALSGIAVFISLLALFVSSVNGAAQEHSNSPPKGESVRYYEVSGIDCSRVGDLTFGLPLHYFGSHSYQIAWTGVDNSDGVTWWEALSIANLRCLNSENAYLASIESEEENTFVKSLVANATGFVSGDTAWIGGVDLKGQKCLEWFSGSVFLDGKSIVDSPFSNFCSGESGGPAAGENCVQLNQEELGCWSAKSCYSKAKFFVIEYNTQLYL